MLPTHCFLVPLDGEGAIKPRYGRGSLRDGRVMLLRNRDVPRLWMHVQTMACTEGCTVGNFLFVPMDKNPECPGITRVELSAAPHSQLDFMELQKSSRSI